MNRDQIRRAIMKLPEDKFHELYYAVSDLDSNNWTLKDWKLALRLAKEAK